MQRPEEIDLDGDCTIGTEDFWLWQSNYGKSIDVDLHRRVQVFDQDTGVSVAHDSLKMSWALRCILR